MPEVTKYGYLVTQKFPFRYERVNNIYIIIIIMDNNETLYLKTDDNKVINEKCIKWVKKMNDCLEVCTRSIGCSSNATNGDTHRICKYHTPDSYNKLNKMFL